MKLSKNQKELIRLMREGYVLQYGNRINRQKIAYLSHKDISNGIDVHAGTAYFLIRNKTVATTEDTPFIGTASYYLTELGKTININ